MYLDAYLACLDVDRASVDPSDPSSLTRLYTAHCRTIPFCTIPLTCGMPVDPKLEIAALADKLLAKRFGAVCFEHCILVADALKQLGFDSIIMGGEVWPPPPRPAAWTPPNSHATLLVSFPSGEQYVCDMGHPLRPLEPLRLVEGVEQCQSDGRGFRLVLDQVDSPGCWIVDMHRQGDWVRQHRFRTQPIGQPELEGPARSLSLPESPFQNGWLLSICRPDGAHVSLATGGWAGASVPPDHAKYVVRLRGAGKEGDGTERPVVHHTERLLLIDSEELRRLAEEEFRTGFEVPRGE